MRDPARCHTIRVFNTRGNYRLPGSRLVGADSSGYKNGEATWATTIGFATTRDYSTRGRVRPATVIAFYRRALRNRWRLLQVYPRVQVNFKRGDAYLEISTAPGHFELRIDYDCYKGNSTPECFGP